MAGMLELDFDPETVCRICLSSGTKLFNLYQSTVVDGYILAVPEMISRCLDLQVFSVKIWRADGAEYFLLYLCEMYKMYVLFYL